MSEAPILHVIDGDYGLVSLDVDCIHTILCAKLNKIPVEVRINNSLRACAFSGAPSLQDGKTSINSVSEILAHFKRIGKNCDGKLTPKQCSESLALTSLTLTKLKPIVEYTYWLDQRNCDEFTRRWFMQALPFPFNFSYIKSRKKSATDLIETLYPLDDNLEVIREYLSKAASECLQTLATRLGQSKYFHEDYPTSLDALVYSYLAPFAKIPFPSNEVVSLLTMWPNLDEFIKRIDAKHFPEIKKDVKYLKSEETKKQNDDEVSYMAIFILTVSAVSLLVGFALRRNIIRVSQFR